MGQYWKVINLDKDETYGGWGKLGECLFNGSPRCLNQSLRVAPTLPDCDSLISPVKPGTLFRDGLELYKDRPTYCPKTAIQSCAFLKFPMETIQEIYSHFHDLADIVCLSLTSQFLWDIGRQELYRHIEMHAARSSWAGDRIICIGDYLDDNDLPDNVFTPAEEAYFLGEEDHYTLYDYPFQCISRPRCSFNVADVFMHAKIFTRMERAWGELQIFYALVNRQYTAPEPTQPVLRNLSRHQYVRESALVRWKDGMLAEMEEARRVGFGEIVLSRISFSSDSSVSMRYAGDIHRGVWAGDRFDIVGSEWLEGLDVDTAAAWVDVSDEVLKEVEGIWRSEYR
ncbi:hypothetical protein B0H14DRAFT_3011301 [Mycena olivaceomarginata]|nr:hypothetical protein B0H14DRAFT_3011301 [Mycena olivaceomarginata]